MPRQKEIYQAVMNYMCNTIGVSRTWIEGIVIRKVEQVVERKINELFNTQWFENLLTKTLNKFAKIGIPGGGNYYDKATTDFEQYVKSEIKDAVRSMILKTYSVEVKLEKKS